MAKYLVSVVCCLLFCASLAAGAEHVITSDRTTDWGTWGSMARCPTGSFVVSFIQRVESDQGLFADDTAMNAIQMNCAPASNPNNVTRAITSTVGPWGDWGSLYSCIPSFMSGFNLKVEAYQGSSDDTATNTVRAICSDGKTIDASGGGWGSWRAERNCDYRHAVCGVQTQIEPDRGSDDDTALNNISLLCCPLPNMAETCTPQENYRTAVVCDNTQSTTESECQYSYQAGVGYAPENEETGKGWEGSGFTLKDAVKDLPKTFEKHLSEKAKCSFTQNVFAENFKVSNAVSVPAGVKSTISYLTADCAHYTVATRKIRREDVSKAGKVVAVTYFDI